MKIIAVNSRCFSIDELTRAIAASMNTRQPMEFIVDNSGYFSVSTVDYRGGLQYPHFERIGGTDDADGHPATEDQMSINFWTSAESTGRDCLGQGSAKKLAGPADFLAAHIFLALDAGESARYARLCH